MMQLDLSDIELLLEMLLIYMVEEIIWNIFRLIFLSRTNAKDSLTARCHHRCKLGTELYDSFLFKA